MRAVQAADLAQGGIRARQLTAQRLITTGGKEAATTRAVAAAASVQAPTIYRLFGDKNGLIDATAEYAMAKYVATKSAKSPDRDALQDLRIGWDEHVAFGLSQPGLFTIISGDQRFEMSPAAQAGADVLRKRIRRVAEQGLLRVSEERAVALLQAVGVGVIKRLLEQPESERDLGLSELAREAVLAAISGKSEAPASTGVIGAALALKASLDAVDALSAGERLLLEELLTRIAEQTPPTK